ncbi:MAG: SDR family NAD(P)-dependent oxidoreductase [Lachnospiraceae bacterium]|nr:SDR family NAD(P)-dependent oxidoreductase [Lachnospiraceae bacterium]
MKIGIVTGASSGMGKEFVKMILNEKEPLDELWVIARRRERLEHWQTWYTNQKFRILALDLQKEEDIKQLETELEEASPEIDVCVQSAGFGVMGQIDEISRKDQADMVDLNCRSVVEVTSLVLPYMVRGGSMIYMASAAAFLPQPGFAVYAASKAFVYSYVRALQSERRDLNITVVCPGAVKTEFFNRAAANKPLPAYKKIVMANPCKVVKRAWKDNQKGKKISVYSPIMRAFRAVVKIIPHSIFLPFINRKEADR